LESLLVSIIIPTFNRAHLIGETLDSVLAQTYTNWECVVVDDGSTDATNNIVNTYIKKDSRFQYHNRPNNRPKGANACRNYGFEICKGQIINWVDSDDVLVNNHLILHLNAHEVFKTDSIVSHTETFRGHKGNLIHHWSNIQPHNDIVLEMIQTKTLWAIGAVTWTRESISALPFDESLSSSQEWTFHLMQVIKQKTYHVISTTTYLVRSHDQRIGKDLSQRKCHATFLSRLIIFKTLYANNELTKSKEKSLLSTMFKSLYYARLYAYNRLLFKFIKTLLKQLNKTSYKTEVLKKIFFSVPVFIITGKGYSLFKIKART